MSLSRSEQFCLLLSDNSVPSDQDFASLFDEASEADLYNLPESGRHIVAIGRVRLSPRPATTDERVRVTEPHVIEPVPLRLLVGLVPTAERRRASDLLDSVGGVAMPPLGEALVDALLELRPGLRETVQRLRRLDEQESVVGAAGRVLAMERDAVKLALSIAGLSTDVLSEWSGPDSTGFLSALPQRRGALEDVVIAHDSARFSNWEALSGEMLDWINFSDGQQHVRVGNVNRTRLENVLGVDLIYHHLDADTFVLVQYKRMVQNARGEWLYYPDEQLDRELASMRKVETGDNSSAADPATWRLHAKGCYLKLVRDPRGFDPNDTRLLPGIYLPLEYVDEIWESRERGRGWRRLGYDNIDRYITSDLFVALVRQGWIGTRGVTTRAVEGIVEAFLAEGRSIILAEEWGHVSGATRRRGRPRP